MPAASSTAAEKANGFPIVVCWFGSPSGHDPSVEVTSMSRSGLVLPLLPPLPVIAASVLAAVLSVRHQTLPAERCSKWIIRYSVLQ